MFAKMMERFKDYRETYDFARGKIRDRIKQPGELGAAYKKRHRLSTLYATISAILLALISSVYTLLCYILPTNTIPALNWSVGLFAIAMLMLCRNYARHFGFKLSFMLDDTHAYYSFIPECAALITALATWGAVIVKIITCMTVAPKPALGVMSVLLLLSIIFAVAMVALSVTIQSLSKEVRAHEARQQFARMIESGALKFKIEDQTISPENIELSVKGGNVQYGIKGIN